VACIVQDGRRLLKETLDLEEAAEDEALRDGTRVHKAPPRRSEDRGTATLANRARFGVAHAPDFEHRAERDRPAPAPRESAADVGGANRKKGLVRQRDMCRDDAPGGPQVKLERQRRVEEIDPGPQGKARAGARSEERGEDPVEADDKLEAALGRRRWRRRRRRWRRRRWWRR
jgi:hypothetical protein